MRQNATPQHVRTALRHWPVVPTPQMTHYVVFLPRVTPLTAWRGQGDGDQKVKPPRKLRVWTGDAWRTMGAVYSNDLTTPMISDN